MRLRETTNCSQIGAAPTYLVPGLFRPAPLSSAVVDDPSDLTSEVMSVDDAIDETVFE